ncbi:hypothetical protein ABZ897_59895 [Nonomuraea sp. NPDC046802]|uniref:hypothetical protein n=1 Tax=Nonomuraea sp. NPDC046802 TaxID=3154919 RepID=UPI0033DAF082
MTTTTIQRPPHAEARHLLACAAERARQSPGLLAHPVDHAVLQAVLGATGALLGDRRGGERLAEAGDQLRACVATGQADAQEAAIAHLLLAVLYALAPDVDSQAQHHLQEADDLADTSFTDGDLLVQSALAALTYALMAAESPWWRLKTPAAGTPFA